MKQNKKAFKLILIIPIALLLVAVIGFGLVCLIYNMQCNDISGEERRIMTLCESADEDLENIKYANKLKSNNNGYRNYDYYDVCTVSGETYIVEIREGDDDWEYSLKHSYTNMFNRNTILGDMVGYRNSKVGQFSDDVADDLRDLNN